MGSKYWQPFRYWQRRQLHAFVVDQESQWLCGSHWLFLAIKPPSERITFFIPQIAALARNLGSAFIARTLLCKLYRFSTYAGDGRPDKSIIAPTLELVARFAKCGLGELYPAFEQFVVNVVWRGQRAQLQFIGLLQAMVFFWMVFDQQARRRYRNCRNPE